MKKSLLLILTTLLLFVLTPTVALSLNDDRETLTTVDGKTIIIENSIHGIAHIIYDSDTKEYILHASPNPNYVFTSWDGLPDGIDKRNDIVRLTVTDDLVISPNFTEFIENPDIGDNVINFFILFGITFITLFFALILNKLNLRNHI